ncbi:MAG: hypothetical protein ACLP7Q_02470 [Isosphaeraceae bacterium]
MNLDLAVAYAQVPGFPAGSVVAGIVATIVGTAAGNTTPVTQQVPPTTNDTAFSFAVTVADTYNYSVYAVDAAGNTFGTPVTGSFAVLAPATVILTLPSAVTASQS